MYPLSKTSDVHAIKPATNLTSFVNRKAGSINKINNVCFDCLQNGLIVVNTGRESIKIGPPLSITDTALKEGLEVLEQSIGKFFHASN